MSVRGSNEHPGEPIDRTDAIHTEDGRWISVEHTVLGDVFSGAWQCHRCGHHTFRRYIASIGCQSCGEEWPIEARRAEECEFPWRR